MVDKSKSTTPTNESTESIPPAVVPVGSQPMVRDYWPHFNRRANTIAILIQLAIVSAISLALVAGGIHPTSSVFIVTIIVIGALTITLNLMLVKVLLKPLRDVSAALTHISGEPTDVTPPNPNAEQFEGSRFKPLLDLIYKLASSEATAKSISAPASGSEPALSAAFDRAKASVVTMSGDGTITYASKAAPVTTDSDGNRSLELVFDVDQSIDQWREASVDRLVKAHQSWRRIPNRLASDPKRRFYDVQASYEQGNDTEIILIFIDQTATYQPEEDQLDFISFAAHELRGPVTVIRGYLDVLAQEIGDEIGPTHRALVDRLTVSANRLSTYINNILNASKYDRRHLKIHIAERRLSDIYHSIADDMALRASTQNRLLSVSIPDDLPTIAADSSSLSEVLANLIDNALKYSHEGGAVQVVASASDSFVKVAVTDYGIGMPSSVLSNLFHKFYRSHRSRETVAGTGIGLYICKAIIESHGGIIEVKSEVGKGSVFTFTLPIYATVADKLAKAGHTNDALIRTSSGGWIKNHAKIRG